MMHLGQMYLGQPLKDGDVQEGRSAHSRGRPGDVETPTNAAQSPVSPSSLRAAWQQLPPSWAATRVLVAKRPNTLLTPICRWATVGLLNKLAISKLL